MVTRVGGSFKETLRQSGGLDNIFNVMVNCHSELEVSPYVFDLFYSRLRQNYQFVICSATAKDYEFWNLVRFLLQ
jgi:hypothetical protein